MELISDLGGILLGIPELLLFFAEPLCLQLLLYLPAKKMLRKCPPPVLYAVCLVLNTAVLVFHLRYMDQAQDPAEMEPMDAFDTLIQAVIWAPSYLGVLIGGIVTAVNCFRKHHPKE